MWRKEDIAYCANVHPGITPQAIEANLSAVTEPVRLANDLSSMSAGLWICEAAARQYSDPENLQRLKACLANTALKVITLNGFPQGDFHQAVVKDAVYSPDWAQSSRLEFTISLAHILASCMPDDVSEGTISTLPLGYRRQWNTSLHEDALDNICGFIHAARGIYETTGKSIRLCIEMEPGCVLETTDQVITFFCNDLSSAAQKQGLSDADVKKYVGICFDICHQAVMHENITTVVKQIDDAGIIIGKIQVSSALVVSSLNDARTRTMLEQFAEPKYLHQVTAKDHNGARVFRDDLKDVLASGALDHCLPWYVHFHLPIQTAHLVDAAGELPGLSTTRADIETMCDSLMTLDYAPHLEIETYTWHVLPGFQGALSNKALIDGLSGERQWLVQQLKNRNLLKI